MGKLSNLEIERKFISEFEYQKGSQELKLKNNNSEYRRSLARTFFIKGVLFIEDHQQSQITKLKKQIEILFDAVEFYGDEETYEWDRGAKARQALEKYKEIGDE